MKFTQKQIKEMADEWAGYDVKIRKAEEIRNAELEPLTRKYSDATAPIYEKHDPKIKALYEKKFAIEKQVLAWLESHGEVIALSGNKAVAANENKVGSRVLSARKFFDFVKDKNYAFWGCISVGMAKAEELIGKSSVDAMATKPTKLVATLKLK